MEKINSSKYWQDRYLENSTQWDIGYPSPAIVSYLEKLENKALKILIPGCGNAYEAKYILDSGFNDLTLIDFAAEPVTKLRTALAIYSTSVNIIEGDFFELKDQYDLIIEHTFFCALKPDKRVEYVQKMKALLRPNGKLVGLLFDREFEAGPPFGGNKKAYKKLFSSVFENVDIKPCLNSIPARQGSEVFIEIS